ncbi:MAG: cell filamentation protein Fic, partial [Bacteroidales bacterium]|nr:cell filamentation protein Fic [Bacteroidales bacterium]
MAAIDKLIALIEQYKNLGIDSQIDYEKFYLYSIITHSTAIEGSTVTEIENQLLFDEGISAKGKTIVEQMMNLDLKKAYEESIRLAKAHSEITIDVLKSLSRLVMQNT